MDDRRYQVKVQQRNKGKYALQVSKPHPETQQKRIRSKTESEHRPPKKNLFFTNLVTYPKKRLAILNKISKFGGNCSLW